MPKKITTRFPFINLTKAIDRAQAIFESDKSGKGLKTPVAFSAWGYSDKSSGGFQTVAALIQYGLLEGEGGGQDRVLKLTPEARRFFQTEIEEEKASLMAKFAQRPKLMNHLLEHWDCTTVPDPVARSYLKTEVGLNEQSARAALGIYKDNLSFAASKGSGMGSEPEPGNLETEPEGQPEDHSVQDTRAQHAPPSGAPAQFPGNPFRHEQAGPGLNVMRLADGYVIHLSGAVMTKAHADEVITLMTALKPTLSDGESGGETAEGH